MVRRAAGLLVVVCIGAVLAGCGDDGGGEGNGVVDLTADEILVEAREAAGAAESVSIVGSIPIEGETTDLDITYGAAGGAGTISVMGTEVELLSVDGAIYMRASADAWETMAGDPAAGQMLADKYVQVPADDAAFAELAGFLDLDGFTDEVLVSSGEISKGDETEVNGQAVIALVDEDGSTLYVATTGEPLPIQIAPPEGETGSLDFEWGVDADFTAPDEADVVDLTQL